MRKTKIISLTTIVALSFGLNGCILDRIKQRLHPKSHKSKKIVSNNNISQNIQQKQTVLPVEKQYTPSKPTAPIYKNSEKKSVESKKETKHKKIVKKKIIKKHHKPKKIAPEPYSIEKNEQDPELLGPQTTLHSNPLTKKTKAVKDKKKVN